MGVATHPPAPRGPRCAAPTSTAPAQPVGGSPSWRSTTARHAAHVHAHAFRHEQPVACMDLLSDTNIL
eukprot:223268-Chlamydomonas_euryale.AAC.1